MYNYSPLSYMDLYVSVFYKDYRGDKIGLTDRKKERKFISVCKCIVYFRLGSKYANRVMQMFGFT